VIYLAKKNLEDEIVIPKPKRTKQIIRKRNPANVPAKRYAQAKTLWKLYKSRKLNATLPKEKQVNNPLTDEQVQTLLGTAYYHHFKEIGWIENPPY